MKRKIAMFAALAMLIGSLAGCTSAGGPDAQESTTQGVTTTQAGTDGEKTTAAPEETTQGEWTGEVDHVIMTYLTLGNTPADLQVVQDAVNEITAKKIGVEVEFKAISCVRCLFTVSYLDSYRRNGGSDVSASAGSEYLCEPGPDRTA